MRNPLTLAGAAATIVLIAGCGSSDDKTTTSSSAAASTAPTTTASTAAETSTSATESGVQVSTKHSKLGTILAAGPKKRTVYLFEKDKGPSSTCSGPCAGAWPPVVSSGAPRAGGQALSSDLSLIARSDGSEQVAYKGHPLYYFVKDEDDEDAYGQGSKAFGADWYVLSPSGKKVDEDEDSPKREAGHAEGGDDS